MATCSSVCTILTDLNILSSPLALCACPHFCQWTQIFSAHKKLRKTLDLSLTLTCPIQLSIESEDSSFVLSFTCELFFPFVHPLLESKPSWFILQLYCGLHLASIFLSFHSILKPHQINLGSMSLSPAEMLSVALHIL